MEARKKILCIEDDREAAALIVEELADQGFEPIAAHDGQAGFEAILEHMPDLVLCDINMPIMSGFEVLERLNAFAPRFGRIPFVFLTALADQENELRGRRLGADDYVVKPIDFEVLHTIINGGWPTRRGPPARLCARRSRPPGGGTTARQAKVLTRDKGPAHDGSPGRLANSTPTKGGACPFELRDSHQRGHHPIPADHHQGYE
jgi:DNA-binding response OmpR family regulator